MAILAVVRRVLRVPSAFTSSFVPRPPPLGTVYLDTNSPPSAYAVISANRKRSHTDHLDGVKVKQVNSDFKLRRTDEPALPSLRGKRGIDEVHWVDFADSREVKGRRLVTKLDGKDKVPDWEDDRSPWSWTVAVNPSIEGDNIIDQQVGESRNENEADSATSTTSTASTAATEAANISPSSTAVADHSTGSDQIVEASNEVEVDASAVMTEADKVDSDSPASTATAEAVDASIQPDEVISKQVVETSKELDAASTTAATEADNVDSGSTASTEVDNGPAMLTEDNLKKLDGEGEGDKGDKSGAAKNEGDEVEVAEFESTDGSYESDTSDGASSTSGDGQSMVGYNFLADILSEPWVQGQLYEAEIREAAAAQRAASTTAGPSTATSTAAASTSAASSAVRPSNAASTAAGPSTSAVVAAPVRTTAPPPPHDALVDDNEERRKYNEWCKKYFKEHDHKRRQLLEEKECERRELLERGRCNFSTFSAPAPLDILAELTAEPDMTAPAFYSEDAAAAMDDEPMPSIWDQQAHLATGSSGFAASRAAFGQVAISPAVDDYALDEDEGDEAVAMDIDQDDEDLAAPPLAARDGPWSLVQLRRAPNAPAPAFYSANPAAIPAAATVPAAAATTATPAFSQPQAQVPASGPSAFATSPGAFAMAGLRSAPVAAAPRQPIFGNFAPPPPPTPTPVAAGGPVFAPSRGFGFVQTSTAYGAVPLVGIFAPAPVAAAAPAPLLAPARGFGTFLPTSAAFGLRS